MTNTDSTRIIIAKIVQQPTCLIKASTGREGKIKNPCSTKGVMSRVPFFRDTKVCQCTIGSRGFEGESPHLQRTEKS